MPTNRRGVCHFATRDSIQRKRGVRSNPLLWRHLAPQHSRAVLNLRTDSSGRHRNCAGVKQPVAGGELGLVSPSHLGRAGPPVAVKPTLPQRKQRSRRALE